MLLSTQTVAVRPSPLTFIRHYVFVSLPSTQNTWCAFLLVSTSICYHISTGAGIFVEMGDGSVPTGVLPNNGIVISRTGGTRIQFQCRSGSLDTGVGQLVDLDGNTFNTGQNSGVFSVASIGNPVQPGSIRIQTVTSLTADDEGVYSCHIPDETGTDVDVNIGLYRNGFNSKSVHLRTYL